MLTAEGIARSRTLLRRFGNVVEFVLQYLVVIVVYHLTFPLGFVAGNILHVLTVLFFKCIDTILRHFTKLEHAVIFS